MKVTFLFGCNVYYINNHIDKIHFIKFVLFFWNEKRYQCGTGRRWGYHGQRWRFLTAQWRNIPWFRLETWGYSRSEELLMYSRFQERRSNSSSSSSGSWTSFLLTNLRKNETKNCENLTCGFLCLCAEHDFVAADVRYKQECIGEMHVTCQRYVYNKMFDYVVVRFILHLSKKRNEFWVLSLKILTFQKKKTERSLRCMWRRQEKKNTGGDRDRGSRGTESNYRTGLVWFHLYTLLISQREESFFFPMWRW